MHFSLATDWTQLALWPCVFVSAGECDCCGETEYAIGVVFGPWHLAVACGG